MGGEHHDVSQGKGRLCLSGLRYEDREAEGTDSGLAAPSFGPGGDLGGRDGLVPRGMMNSGARDPGKT